MRSKKLAPSLRRSSSIAMRSGSGTPRSPSTGGDGSGASSAPVGPASVGPPPPWIGAGGRPPPPAPPVARPQAPQLRSTRSIAGVDGLGEVVVHARLQAALALALERGGGHRDDRDPTPDRLALADLPGRVEPVETGHPAVHQHDGVVVRAGDSSTAATPSSATSTSAAGSPGSGGDQLVDPGCPRRPAPGRRARAVVRPSATGALDAPTRTSGRR